MSEAQSIIASLYLPVSHQQLLLPNVSVAEVVGYQQPIKSIDSPEHFLGIVRWRGIDIPVISYEIANGQKAGKKASNARIAVINSIGDNHEKLPFFAIVTQGIPRLVKVSNDLIKKSKKKMGAADAAIVKVDGEEAVIPNIAYLETLALGQL